MTVKQIIISLVATGTIIGGTLLAATLEPQEIKIEGKVLTAVKYAELKTDLITKYETQGYFTPNEWQTYAAVVDWEAKAGKVKLQNVNKQNLISKIMNAIK